MKKKLNLTKTSKKNKIHTLKLATAKRKLSFEQNSQGGFLNGQKHRKSKTLDRRLLALGGEIDTSSNSNLSRGFFGYRNDFIDRLRLCSIRQERRGAVIAVHRSKLNSGAAIQRSKRPVWTAESRIQCR